MTHFLGLHIVQLILFFSGPLVVSHTQLLICAIKMQVRLSQSEEGVRQEQNENYFHQFFLTADLDSPLILLIFQPQRASVFPEYSLDF